MRDDVGPRSPSLIVGLLPLIIGQYRLSVNGIHGIGHWGRVLENARVLARLTGADSRVIEYFAIFHDACRHNDGRDPEHGPRGAGLARENRAALGLDERELALLLEACECHTRGPRPGADITVLTCLDADRLDIPRVGPRIRPELLFTPAARDRRMISWAGGRGAGLVAPRVCLREWGLSDSRH